MTPRILAVRSAFPEHRLTQAEITHAFASRSNLGPPKVHGVPGSPGELRMAGHLGLRFPGLSDQKKQIGSP